MEVLWTKRVAGIGEIRDIYRNLVGKLLREKQLGRLRR
jgi:hypothetical protein